MKILQDIKLILLLLLIYQLQIARSSFEDSGTDMDESLDLNESKSNAASSEEDSHKHRHAYRAGHRHKKSHRSSHDHDHDHDHAHLRTKSKESNDDCECSCYNCDPPSDCCQSACNTCPANPYQHPGRGQASVVFVPYPYPMMMPSSIVKPAPGHQIMRTRDTTLEPTSTSTSTTTPATTTTTTTTTTTAATTTTTTATTTTEDLIDPTDLTNSQGNNRMLEEVLKSVVNDYANIIAKTPEKLENGNNKYTLTSLRRTKPTWMPKFGIVPITNNIAEKLMSKISRSRVPLRSQQQRRPIYDKSYLRTLGKKF